MVRRHHWHSMWYSAESIASSSWVSCHLLLLPGNAGCFHRGCRSSSSWGTGEGRVSLRFLAWNDDLVRSHEWWSCSSDFKYPVWSTEIIEIGNACAVRSVDWIPRSSPWSGLDGCFDCLGLYGCSRERCWQLSRCRCLRVFCVDSLGPLHSRSCLCNYCRWCFGNYRSFLSSESAWSRWPPHGHQDGKWFEAMACYGLQQFWLARL